MYGFGFWAPQIIQSLGALSLTYTGWLGAVPYARGALAMLISGWHSDRSGGRRWHLALSMLAGATGLSLGAASGRLTLALPAFALAAMGIFAALPVCWTLPIAALTDTAAAGGIALINSIGTLSGYVGPVLMGRLKDHTGDHGTGLAVLGGGLLLAAVGVLAPRLSVLARPRN